MLQTVLLHPYLPLSRDRDTFHSATINAHKKCAWELANSSLTEQQFVLILSFT